MLKLKNIAIISSECLISMGLTALISDFFSPKNTLQYETCEDYFREENFTHADFIFLSSDLYVAHCDSFHSVKNKLIILSQANNNGQISSHSLSILYINQSQNKIIEQLEKIFKSKTRNQTVEIQEGLSEREIEVLKLVSLGLINKEIGDKLCISLHTVISHRKNITRKLGIKTVSGLTVYALLNGIISSE